MDLIDIILLVLLLVGAFSFLKSLSAENRKKLLKAGANATIIAGVATAKASKEIVSSTYKAGDIAAMQTEKSMQGTIDSIDELSQEVESKGGANKVAIKGMQDFGNFTGLSEIGNAIDDKHKELVNEKAAGLKDTLANR